MDASHWWNLAQVAIPVTITGVFAYILATKRAEKDTLTQEKDRLNQELDTRHRAEDKFRDDYLARLDKVEPLVYELQKEITRITVENALLRSDNDMKHALIETLERRRDVMPFPTWEKRSDGLMLKINQRYVDLVLVPLGLTREDCEGKTDVENHGPVRAAEYKLADEAVYKSGRPWVGFESYPKSDGTNGKAPCLKWPASTTAGMPCIKGVIGITEADVFV